MPDGVYEAFSFVSMRQKSNRFLKECGIPKAILVTSTTVQQQ